MPRELIEVHNLGAERCDRGRHGVVLVHSILTIRALPEVVRLEIGDTNESLPR